MTTDFLRPTASTAVADVLAVPCDHSTAPPTGQVDLDVAGGSTRDHRLEPARRADVVLVAGASLDAFRVRYGTLFAEVATADFRAAAPVEDPAEFGPDGRLNPRAAVAALEDILPKDRSVVMDGGHFMGWAPMYLSVPDPQAMVLVGTALQSIGLGLGSAAGVSVARPERTTVLVTGDGGGLMGLADLETFIRATRRGVVVVLNDSAYGAELHQYASQGLDPTAMLIDEVDFAAVGRALGADGAKATTLDDLTVLTDWLAAHDEGVFVLDVAISQKVVVEFMAASLTAGKKL